MSRPISTTADVPADVERTFLAISSERWPQAVGEALGDDSRVESREQLPDGGVRLVHSRRLPDGVPGFLQRFLPQDGRVTQIDTWGPAGEDGSRQGTWRVDFAGAPGSVGGATAVLPAGDGSRWTVDGEAKVRIPLVGGRAEGFIAPLVERLVARQADVLRELVRG